MTDEFGNEIGYIKLIEGAGDNAEFVRDHPDWVEWHGADCYIKPEKVAEFLAWERAAIGNP